MKNVRTELQHLRDDQLRDVYIANMNPDKVCCLNLKGELNIGMIVRSAELFHMSGVVILGRRMYDKRTTVGMHHYIPIERMGATLGDHSEELDLPLIISLLEEWSKTYQLVFVEQGGISITEVTTLKQEKPWMLILGSEDEGIPSGILDASETLHALRISIPQLGLGRSFNVSHAFAIVAYEMVRSQL